MIKAPVKKYQCSHCLSVFDSGDAQKICSNCFACTGCETYCCPNCGEEVIIKPIKPYQKKKPEGGL